MGAALVSVITPGRHRLSTLARCVASVQRQVNVQFEHILIADASQEFHALAVALAGDFSNVSAQFTADMRPPLSYVPARLARVRNAGVALARGNYIAFLDDDNTWEPDHLETLVATLEADHALGGAFSNRALWNADGTPYVEQRHPWNNAARAEARYGELRDLGMYVPGTNLVRDQTWVARDGTPLLLCSVDASAWLLRAAVARAYPFRTEFTADEMARREAEDTAFCLTLCRAGVRVAASGRHTLNYFLGGFSTTVGEEWRTPVRPSLAAAGAARPSSLGPTRSPDADVGQLSPTSSES